METDLLLINAARKMNEESLVKIFDLYAPPLYKYALRLCGDPMRADHIIIDEARSSRRWFSLGALTSLRSDVRSASLGMDDQILFELIMHAIQHDLTDDQRHVCDPFAFPGRNQPA